MYKIDHISKLQNSEILFFIRFRTLRIFWDEKIGASSGRLLRSKHLEDSLNFEYKIDRNSMNKNRKIYFSFFSAHCVSLT